MRDGLTERQRQVLQFIKDEIRKRGYPPSVREIGEAIGLSSSSTVHGHLARLEEKGYIRRDPTKPRAIEVLDHDEPEPARKRVVSVPIVGRVTAGTPILAVENIEDYFTLPADFLRPDEEGEVFFLQVQGDSMIEAGILDGDYVLVRRQSTARNGDIVVALVPGPEDMEATVKRFYKEADHIRLQPENRHMEPIRVKDCTILGRVIGLVRRMG
ncbi:MAG: transcriptional repressor LexA [Bacillota bacterium]